LDNDFPTMMAGGKLGFKPMDIKAGLGNGSLDALRVRSQIGSLWPKYLISDPMAPEGSEPLYTALGSVQPPETFGAPMA
jgi:hypothetical protein